MAFENGSATDAADLLSRLHSFIDTETDWVVDEYDTGSDELHVHDSGGNGYWSLKAVADMDAEGFGFQTDHPGIAGYLATGYASGSAWDAQPNTTSVSRGLGCFPNTSVPEYWFFTDGTSYVHAVVRSVGTAYSHLQIGLLTQFGSWTGGAYLSGVVVQEDEGRSDIAWLDNDRADADLRADIDGESNFFLSGQDQSLGALVQPDFSGNNSGGDFRSPFDQVNEWNNRAVFLPIYVKGQRQDGTNNWSYLGYPPDVRVLNARYINPAQSVTIGSDEWVVFPWYNRGDAFDTADFIGFAYRKVTP
jgi:hypothetical protein